MKIPNSDRAVIQPSKLSNYLLNVEHKRGGSKAKLLIELGDSPENWQELEIHLRNYHLTAEVDVVKETDY